MLRFSYVLKVLPSLMEALAPGLLGSSTRHETAACSRRNMHARLSDEATRE